MPLEITDKELGREEISNTIKQILISFEDNIKDINFKKGIYLYGSPGSGKTFFITRLLNEINYDIVHYNAGDVRNKTLIENIASNNMSCQNVLKMMYKRKQRIAIVMDEIEGMNNGDKGSITALIKLIRQKKTKKQKTENQTLNPIICIGNYFMDKKIKELMKVCHVFEIKTPTNNQIWNVISTFNFQCNTANLRHVLLDYIQGDLRKLNFVYKLLDRRPDIFSNHGDKFQTIFQIKTNNDDSKKIVQQLLHKYVPLSKHRETINETDRTIVALLWHENIVDLLQNLNATEQSKWKAYSNILKNICFADYIDRITFQNQIWQFNEMSSMIKTFYCNKLFHDFAAPSAPLPPLKEIRFTKVLTKYSTEYNNNLFINHLCDSLEMDKKDLLSMFQELRLSYDDLAKTNWNDFCNLIHEKINNVNVDLLDIKRIYRFLDKNMKKPTIVCFNEEEEEEQEEIWENQVSNTTF